MKNNLQCCITSFIYSKITSNVVSFIIFCYFLFRSIINPSSNLLCRVLFYVHFFLLQIFLLADAYILKLLRAFLLPIYCSFLLDCLIMKFFVPIFMILSTIVHKILIHYSILGCVHVASKFCSFSRFNRNPSKQVLYPYHLLVGFKMF